MKTSFNLNDYKGDYVMHCQTEDEADSFLEVLHNAGRKWCDGVSYMEHNNYSKYKHHTAYCFNVGQFGDVTHPTLKGYTVLEWSDFIEDENEIPDEEFHDMLSILLGI